MPKDTISLPDRLRVEGVNCLGYGIIPKYAMLDHDLSITAKAIYAYFCSLSGNGLTSFPALKTILGHLKLGTEAYYKHREMLISQGYLRVDSRKVNNKEFTQNLYTLVSNPKKFSEATPSNQWESTVYSQIQTKGLKGAGYGLIPRAVMYDSRLDAKAKGVYAYFASYAGAGQSVFPSVPKLLEDLQISKATYLKAMKALQECSFIEVRQRNGQRAGKRGFSVNDYFLIDKPDSPQTKNPEAINPQSIKSQTIKSKTKEPKTINPEYTNSIPLDNNIPSANINPSIQIDEIDETGRDEPQEIFEEIDKGKSFFMDEYEKDLPQKYFEEVIRESIYYEDLPLLSPHVDMKLVDNLIHIMAAACTGKDPVKIGGELIPKKDVRQVFTNLEWEHILYVIECVSKQKTSIRNIRSYYLTALYRAPETCDAYYADLVTKDMNSPDWGNSL